MAKILPDTRIGKVQFFENHNADWTANASALGTTTALMSTLSAQTAAARDAFNAQQLAQQQALAATHSYHAAVQAMAATGAQVIAEIKAKAATGGDSVYALALISAPAKPSPLGRPGTPTGFNANLDAIGVLHLTWKCANPAGSSGTVYQISRQIGTAGTMQIISAVGTKKFSDNTIPAGSAQVTYQIQALRSTAAGAVSNFTVHFGVANPGNPISVIHAPKIAA